MRKFILLVTFFSVTLCSVGQNVTLDQVIFLRSKTLADVEEFLTAKNWQLTEATEPGDGTMGRASFAYDKSYYDDKATSFITYFYGKYLTSSNRINIQVSKTATYNTFLLRLKALGYKLSSSKVDDGKIVKIYKGKSHTIEVSSGTQKGNFSTNTTYQFFICTSLDYSLQFED